MNIFKTTHFDARSGFVEIESLVYVNFDGEPIILNQTWSNLSIETLSDPIRQKKKSAIAAFLQVHLAETDKYRSGGE